ncbi:hypothetical protein CTZ27_03870 [Streptomyces griseocarneus]|nr:hypothetical protein CTZ27_03870 [Streptomyces griseocarneus]
MDARGPASGRTIRKGYAAAGVVLAIIWLGERNEPAWAHGLRTAFLLLILPPVLLPANRRLSVAYYGSAHPGRALARLITARVVIVGAAFVAAFFFAKLLDPRASHDVRALAARLLLVLLTVPLQIRLERRARARGAPSARLDLSTPRLICAKLLLVGAALLAEVILDPYVPYAQALIAVAIVVAVTLLGPKIHSKLLLPRSA